MAKRTRITIETNSLLVLRGRMALRSWCAECGAEAEMIAVNEVGVVSNMPAAEVQVWMESADLHHTTTADGATLICLNSMLKRAHRQTGEKRPSATLLLNCENSRNGEEKP